MQTEEQDDLWELLGHAKQPAVSPFFARNVLREIRKEPQARPSFVGWLLAHWKAPVFATCAVALVGGALFKQYSTENAERRQLLAMAQKVSESPDYQIIGHLDELLDSEDNSVWLDSK